MIAVDPQPDEERFLPLLENRLIVRVLVAISMATSLGFGLWTLRHYVAPENAAITNIETGNTYSSLSNEEIDSATRNAEYYEANATEATTVNAM